MKEVPPHCLGCCSPSPPHSPCRLKIWTQIRFLSFSRASPFPPLLHFSTSWRKSYFFNPLCTKRTCCCFHTRPSTLPLWHAHVFSTPVLLPYVSLFHLIMWAGPYFSRCSFPPGRRRYGVIPYLRRRWRDLVAPWRPLVRWWVDRSLQIRAQPLLTWLRVIVQSLGIAATIIAQRISKYESSFGQSNVGIVI